VHYHEDKRNLDVEAGLWRQRRRRFAKCKGKRREKIETEFYYYGKLVYRITLKGVI